MCEQSQAVGAAPVSPGADQPQMRRGDEASYGAEAGPRGPLGQGGPEGQGQRGSQSQGWEGPPPWTHQYAGYGAANPWPPHHHHPEWSEVSPPWHQAPAFGPGYGPSPHAGHAGWGHGYAHGARISDLIDEVANGGTGLSSLSRMLNLDDVEFWKGALVGAVAVLVLTNHSVQSLLFGEGMKKKEAAE